MEVCWIGADGSVQLLPARRPKARSGNAMSWPDQEMLQRAEASTQLRLLTAWKSVGLERMVQFKIRFGMSWCSEPRSISAEDPLSLGFCGEMVLLIGVLGGSQSRMRTGALKPGGEPDYFGLR
jgi:hypothetical protein